MTKKVTVLRHAKAAKPLDGSYVADMAREVALEGEVQTHARRDMLGNPIFNLVIASPSHRTVRTALLVLGFEEARVDEVITLNELIYGDPRGADPVARGIDKLFQKLGYAPLAKYLPEDSEGHVLTHANAAWSEVAFTIGDLSGTNVLVVGHSVLIAAMGYIACAGNDGFQKTLAEANFGECEGYRLTLDDDDFVIELELLR